MKKIFTLVMMLFAVVALNAQNATIVLTVDDVWGDGTGYQILIDADAEGWMDSYGPSCGSQYTQWEYMIPAEAWANDAAVVVNATQSIQIPAGTYSYLILNPGCAGYNKNYIASDQCDPSNVSNYNFEAGKTYTFVPSLNPNGNDCITLTITDGPVAVESVEANQTSVYPNPANNVINVTSAANMNSIEVYTIAGQKVADYTVNGTQAAINVNNLSNGMYIMQIASENGISTKKFNVVR